MAFRELLGIPDMRVTATAWIDFDRDWQLAERLAGNYSKSTFEDLVKQVWSERANVPKEILERRLHGAYSESSKHEQELAPRGWISRLGLEGPLLEMGCGTGGFLVPASKHVDVVGIDVSLAWLITARKRLEEAGRNARLICACGERLPFADGSFASVAAFDVLEHVDAPALVMDELGRVTKERATFIATTPNRFSLTAEPHVGLWGVGLLPRPWMARYVWWRRGIDYGHTHPLSLWDLRRETRRHFTAKVKCPDLWDEDVARFGMMKRYMARLYNFLVRRPWMSWMLLPVAPFFRVVGRRSSELQSGQPEPQKDLHAERVTAIDGSQIRR